MNPKTFVTSLRELLKKAEGSAPAAITPTNPTDVLLAAGSDTLTLAKDIGPAGELPVDFNKRLCAVTKGLHVLALATLTTPLAKAELDAYTATKVTLSGMSDCVWGMQDAFRDGELTELTMHAQHLKVIVDNVLGLAAAAMPGAPPEAEAPPATPAAAAGAAPAAPQKGAEITPEAFVAWAQQQMGEAVKSGDVIKMTSLLKAVEVAKQSFLDEGLPTLPMDKFEAYPGTGGGAKMDLTANADQGVTEGTVQNMAQANGDAAFAMNAGAVLKRLEEMLTKMSAPEPKAVDDSFVWPMDLAAPAPAPEAPAPVQKSAGARDGGFGADPWEPRLSFPTTR